MQGEAAVRFDKGCVYTRTQIHAALGGSWRASLPTRGGAVVCACLTRRKNPRAPHEMLIDGRESAVRLARALAASGRAVPVFVSARPGRWEYAGERRVRSLVEEPGALLALIVEGAPPDIALALLLEEISGAGDSGVGSTGSSPAGPDA